MGMSMKPSKLMTLTLAGLIAISMVAMGCAPPPEKQEKASPKAMAKSPEMKQTTSIPPEITTPDTVETPIGTLDFFDGVPSEKTVQTVYDNLDRSRGVEVFLNTIPGVSMYGLR